MPMFAYGFSSPRGPHRAIGQIEGGFRRRLPKACCGLECVDKPLDLNDGCDMMLPFCASHDGQSVEDRDKPCFATVAFLRIGGLNDGKRLNLTAKSLNLSAQRFLVVFELDNQMCFGLCGGLKSFFWQCRASRVRAWPLTFIASKSFCAAGISLDLSSTSLCASTSAVWVANT